MSDFEQQLSTEIDIVMEGVEQRATMLLDVKDMAVANILAAHNTATAKLLEEFVEAAKANHPDLGPQHNACEICESIDTTLAEFKRRFE